MISPKRNYLFIAVIIIVAFLLAGCSSGPKMLKSTYEEHDVSSCSDSDGEDIYTKGVSEYVIAGDDGRSGSEDICDYNAQLSPSSVGVVRETYCEGEKVVSYYSTCGEGFVCRNGACVSESANIPVCTDSDGGKIIEVYGELYGYGGSGADDCWTSNNLATDQGSLTNECAGSDCYVYEYYCENEAKNYELIPCSSCRDGACIA